jgi:hypothetical protein
MGIGLTAKVGIGLTAKVGIEQQLAAGRKNNQKEVSSEVAELLQQ